MEYNNFLRTYYNTIMDLGTVLTFTPQNIVIINPSETDEKYLEQKDSGFFGQTRVNLGAPNEVIEHEMDRLSVQFPEYQALFLNKIALRNAANKFSSAEDIKKMLFYVITVYKELGLVKVNGD